MSKETVLKPDDVIEDYSCTTHMKSRTFRLKWTIENYDFLSKNVNILNSPAFPLDGDEAGNWHIEVELQEIIENSEKELKFTLRRKDCKVIHIDVSLSLESNSEKVYQFAVYRGILKGKYLASKQTGKIIHDKLQWNETSDKTLMIICKIRIFDSMHSTDSIVSKKISTKPFESNDLSQDISKLLLNDDTFQDVEISVDEKTFKAHKNILASRSKVFAAMFSSEMSEKNNSLVEIKDLTSETIEKMLHFIYTDQVDDYNLKESASELLAAAEKYDLRRLKEICIIAMHKNLTVENVLKTLEVADIYSILDLKKVALKFVFSHLKAVKSLNEFKTLIVERPHLMQEFMDILIEVPDNLDVQENEKEFDQTMDVPK